MFNRFKSLFNKKQPAASSAARRLSDLPEALFFAFAPLMGVQDIYRYYTINKTQVKVLKSKQPMLEAVKAKLMVEKFLLPEEKNLIPPQLLNDLVDIVVLLHQEIHRKENWLKSLHLKLLPIDIQTPQMTMYNLVGHFLVRLLAQTNPPYQKVDPLFRDITSLVAATELKSHFKLNLSRQMYNDLKALLAVEQSEEALRERLVDILSQLYAGFATSIVGEGRPASAYRNRFRVGLNNQLLSKFKAVRIQPPLSNAALLNSLVEICLSLALTKEMLLQSQQVLIDRSSYAKAIPSFADTLSTVLKKDAALSRKVFDLPLITNILPEEELPVRPQARWLKRVAVGLFVGMLGAVSLPLISLMSLSIFTIYFAGLLINLLIAPIVSLANKKSIIGYYEYKLNQLKMPLKMIAFNLLNVPIATLAGFVSGIKAGYYYASISKYKEIYRAITTSELDLKRYKTVADVVEEQKIKEKQQQESAQNASTQLINDAIHKQAFTSQLTHEVGKNIKPAIATAEPLSAKQSIQSVTVNETTIQSGNQREHSLTSSPS